MVKVDSRSKDEMVNEMVERSKSYTPEWNMDPENPDIASAFALACADMFSGTLKKINGTPLKNKIAFYNMTGASLFPAAPSEGFVSFSLSADDVGSTQLEKGAVLSAYTDDGETIHFETCDDILVSSARIEKIFCADDSEDFIGEYADFKDSKFALFSLPEINLQKHVTQFTHPYAFDLKTEGQIKLRFFRKGGSPVSADFVKLLAKESAADIEYYAGEDYGFVKFSSVREEGGELILTKNADKPAAVSENENECNIRITVKDVAGLEKLSFTRVNALPSGKVIAPDCVTDGNIEYDINAFYPFGEKFQIFNEVYFGCSEALGKPGAQVTLNFDMNVVEVPISDLPDSAINWKWVANKKDFQEEKSYKIAITDVIWEYYNGNGWSRLFPDGSYGDMFNIVQGATASFKSMKFTCPDDMSEVFVGTQSGYYIRARILKAENMYKTKGWYLSPFIKNLSFDYGYGENSCVITDITALNNLHEESYSAASSPDYEGFKPFKRAGADGRSVYFGFSSAPDRGPFSTLWDIDEAPMPRRGELEWSYLTSNGWKTVNMADETEGFTKVGLTVFFDNRDFEKTKLFGEELYWVRVKDVNNSFALKKSSVPLIKSIIHNAVRAVNVDSRNEEHFAMNVYSENAEFNLIASGILDFELYVNELSTITEDEIRELEKENRVIRKGSVGGLDTEVWVKWNEVSSFVTEDADSRSYVLDRPNGSFMFGNGRKGRIPPISDINNIRVVYTAGGGAHTNVKVGSITDLERSYGFISEVTNPKCFYGGCDTETVHEAMKRNAVMLRTQGKIVTVRDLETLTFNASRSIRKLCCVTENSTSSRDGRRVTLVVLKKDGAEFGRVREEIKEFLEGRLPGSIADENSLVITEPTFVKVNVRADIKTDKQNGIFELKKSVENCLSDYLSSFAGADGDNVWQLGAIPNEQQIRSALLRLRNVEYIRSIYITMYITGAGGIKEVDSDTVANYRYILPEDGKHDITITVE